MVERAPTQAELDEKSNASLRRGGVVSKYQNPAKFKRCVFDKKYKVIPNNIPDGNVVAANMARISVEYRRWFESEITAGNGDSVILREDGEVIYYDSTVINKNTQNSLIKLANVCRKLGWYTEANANERMDADIEHNKMVMDMMRKNKIKY